MHKSAKTNRGCLWALAGVSTAIALVPFQGVIWDGGFPDIECRLKFLDSNDRPVPGVRLTVHTQGGAACHFYPVDEFVPDEPLPSDSEGRITFHHSARYLEFGGHSYSNLLGMRFGETSAPQYDYVFSLGDREVFRTRFNFHCREWEAYQKPDVTKRWAPPWNAEQHGPQPDEDAKSWERRLFGAKTRLQMDREERIAAGNFVRRFPVTSTESQGCETTFTVIERTIIVPNP